MLTVLTIAMTAMAFQPGADDAPPSIAVEQRYNAPDSPLMIRITPPPSEPIQLALMDHRGVLLAEPVAGRPGRLDLAELFPRIWYTRQVAYVQMVSAEDELQSFGSALVLQPLLSPMTPKTEQVVNPQTGDAATRIIDWQPPETPAFSGFRAYVEQDVVLQTELGDIRIALRPDEAPNTAWNFRELVRGGFYTNLPFHRIVPMTADGDPFVIQAGDPSGTGSGGPGYHLPLEPSRLRHDFGVISMARADDPNSAGSQFFICLSREGTRRLDGQYAAFGYAVQGAEAVLAIADVPLVDVAAGRPQNPPLIRKATLIPAPPRIIGTGRPDQRITPEEPETEQTPGRVPR